MDDSRRFGIFILQRWAEGSAKAAGTAMKQGVIPIVVVVLGGGCGPAARKPSHPYRVVSGSGDVSGVVGESAPCSANH